MRPSAPTKLPPLHPQLQCMYQVGTDLCLLTADFDVWLRGALEPFEDDIFEKVREVQARDADFDKIEIGVYKGLNPVVRVWPVWGL